MTLYIVASYILCVASLAEKWFNISIPITGIKSTSVVYKATVETRADTEPYALFCDEYSKFDTHLEVYPRKSGEVTHTLKTPLLPTYFNIHGYYNRCMCAELAVPNMCHLHDCKRESEYVSLWEV